MNHGPIVFANQPSAVSMTTLLHVTLRQLESSDLVLTTSETEPAYQFRHALVQDTALASLLNQERKRLNLLVAESLETLYNDNPEEIAVRLYQHYDAAGERDRTMLYAERAGDAASRKSAYAEALIAYRRALEIAEQQPGNSERLIRLMTRLGRTLEEVVRYDDAIALYHRMQELAETRGDRPLELAALVQLAKIHAVSAMRYDPELSAQFSQAALALADALGDQRARARIYWVMMLANVYGGKGAREGIKYGEQSLTLARALDWKEQMAYTLNDMVYIYLNLGDGKRAQDCAAEARALWRELDNKPMLIDNLNAGAMQHFMRGEFESAVSLAHESRNLAQTIGNQWGESTSFMVEGYVAQESGNLADALDALHACLAAGNSVGVKGPIVIACCELAHVYAFLGDAERGDLYARDARQRIHDDNIDWEAWAFALQAYIAEMSGDFETADAAVRAIPDAPPEYYFERMLPTGSADVVLAQVRHDMRHHRWEPALARTEQYLERLRKSGFRVFLPAALVLLVEISLARNEPERARAALVEGETLAQQLGMLPAQLALVQRRIELETMHHNSDGRADAVRTSTALVTRFLDDMPQEFRASFQTTILGKNIVYD